MSVLDSLYLSLPQLFSIGCAVFGSVGFLFSEVGDSFRMGCFCLLIFDVPGNVLLLHC